MLFNNLRCALAFFGEQKGIIQMYKTDSIAILLATHNGEKFIKEQLESLLL